MSSAAALETAKVLRQLQESIALRGPKYQKEYHCIEDSLAQPYIRLDTKWGFVIVRAVYGPSSDALWAQMLEIFRYNVSEDLRLNDHMELLPRHEITIIEDEATLAGAESYGARRAWVAAALPQQLCKDRLEEWSGYTQVRDKLLTNDTHVAPNKQDDASCEYCASSMAILHIRGPGLLALAGKRARGS